MVRRRCPRKGEGKTKSETRARLHPTSFSPSHVHIFFFSSHDAKIYVCTYTVVDGGVLLPSLIPHVKNTVGVLR